MEVIDASRWDSYPVRDVLVWSLTGRPVISVMCRDIEDAERSGLLTTRAAPPEALLGLATAWTRFPVLCDVTQKGRGLALKLAHSAELCEIMERYRPGWSGVTPREAFAELQRREGAPRVDAMAWARSRRRADVTSLPRPGLDDDKAAAQDH